MNNVFKPTEYKLRSVATDEMRDDSGWLLGFDGDSGLIRAEYASKQLNVNSNQGLYKFSDWLPIKRLLKGASSPVTYKSERLAEKLQMTNLYITFNGYWPEKGAYMKTCSFKETEAYSVCARLPESKKDEVLVVSSAGNTARAFAQVCSDNNIKLLITIPEDNIDALWFEKPLNPCVKVIATESGSDYFDAINIGNTACEVEGFFAEGGAKNIARRDGMGTTMLSAATTIGRVPDCYFQAVGSGTGAIAAWENNLRLIADGRFGNVKARLMVSQNKPFTPMFDAWKQDSRTLLPYDDETARKDAGRIAASVLSNRKPPYSLIGGLYDAMKDTNGDFFAVSNEEGLVAQNLFEETEGIDIHPAAGIALASLMQALDSGKIAHNEVVMLNVTGGGEKHFKKNKEIFKLMPSKVFKINTDKDQIKNYLRKIVF